MTLILNNDDVAQALSVTDSLAIMAESYRELADGQAVNRPASHAYLPHSLPQSTYSFKSVEGGVRKFGIMALRITSDVVRENRVGNSVRLDKLPLADGKFTGMVQLFSAETGALLAIMPDGLIQQTRVAVTSALGSKALARPQSSILALIGSGGQARAHLRFLTAVLPIAEVRIFSPNQDNREALAREMSAELGIAMRAVTSAEAAVAGCDVVCTATNASRSVLDPALLAPGMHYNSIREFEMDDAAFAKADVVAIHTHFGGIQHFQPPGTIGDLPGVRREKSRDWTCYPEIQDLLAGKAPGRSNDRQITLFFNNVGTGVQFAAIGLSAYRGAQARGLGREIPTDWFLQDIKP
jgi:alanine dehydrogenase